MRPPSSQSSIPGVPRIPVEDFPLLSPQATAVNPPNGLHPRPSSLRRNQSDEQAKKSESQVDVQGLQKGRTTTTEGVRPLSFLDALKQNGGTMKITDVRDNLENRVRDLEMQLQTLQAFIMDNLPGQASEYYSSPAKVNTTAAENLGPPFQEETPSSKRPDTAATARSLAHGNFMSLSLNPTVMHRGIDLDWKSIAKSNSSPSPRSADAGEPPLFPTPEAMSNRAKTADTLEGVSAGPSSKFSFLQGPSLSATTLAGGQTGSIRGLTSASRPQTPPASNVTLAEYTGLVAMLKSEQRTRKKLEAQVASLQEQMSLVLARQLRQQDQLLSHDRSFASVSTGSLRPEFNTMTMTPAGLRKKGSSEMPTPELTPPRASHDIKRHMFSGFDGVITAGMNVSHSDGDDDDDRSLYMDTKEASTSTDRWETPSEDDREAPVALTAMREKNSFERHVTGGGGFAGPAVAAEEDDEY